MSQTLTNFGILETMIKRQIKLRLMVAIAFTVAGCAAAKRDAQPPAAPGEPSPPNPATTGSGSDAVVGSGSGSPGSVGVDAPPVDVVIALALDDPSAKLAADAPDLLQKLVVSVGAAAKGLRLAVVSGKRDRGGKPMPSAPSGVPADGYKTVDFEVAPVDGLFSALVAGCEVTKSSFPDPHNTEGKKPIACGLDASRLGATPEDLGHAWLWALEPVRGLLQKFFRADSRRVYVVVANGDSEFLDGAGFSKLARTQTKGKSIVIAVAPTDKSKATSCGATSKVATRLSAIAVAANGTSIELCDASVDSVAGAVADAVKRFAE